jgi:hypothetical protein
MLGVNKGASACRRPDNVPDFFDLGLFSSFDLVFGEQF